MDGHTVVACSPQGSCERTGHHFVVISNQHSGRHASNCSESGTVVGMRSIELAGPWQSAIYVELPSKLRSKSNFRRGKKATSWEKYASFEMVAANTFRMARPEGWVLGDKGQPVKERPTVLLVVCARSLLDSSNFTKSIADAMQGELVINDASVTATATLGERAGKDQICGVGTAQLPAGATLEEQATALGSLAVLTVEQFRSDVEATLRA